MCVCVCACACVRVCLRYPHVCLFSTSSRPFFLRHSDVCGCVFFKFVTLRCAVYRQLVSVAVVLINMLHNYDTFSFCVILKYSPILQAPTSDTIRSMPGALPFW